MTIIEPKKNKLRIHFIATIFVGLLLLGGLLTVFAYNQSVSMSHRLGELTKEIEGLRVENADLKNDLYGILDLQNIDKLADKLGLIKEKKPEYLSANR